MRWFSTPRRIVLAAVIPSAAAIGLVLRACSVAPSRVEVEKKSDRRVSNSRALDEKAQNTGPVKSGPSVNKPANNRFDLSRVDDSPFKDDGTISNSVAKHLGVTENERSEIDRALFSYRTDLGAHLVSNAVPQAAGQSGMKSWSVAPFPDLCRKSFATLQEKVGSVLDAERAAALVDGIRVYLTEKGDSEVILIFKPNNPGGETLRVEYRDPATGKRISAIEGARTKIENALAIRLQDLP